MSSLLQLSSFRNCLRQSPKSDVYADYHFARCGTGLITNQFSIFIGLSVSFTRSQARGKLESCETMEDYWV
jgi:hypothetical protein